MIAAYLTDATFTPIKRTSFWDIRGSSAHVLVCRSCGYSELYADNPEQLVYPGQ